MAIRLLGNIRAFRCKPAAAKEKNLPRPELGALLNKGFCIHTFPSGKSIFFSLRQRNLGDALQVNVDAIDLKTRKVAGVLDFSVVGDKAKACALLALADAPFSSGSKIVLERHGFSSKELLPHNFLALRQTPRNVAFFVRKGYRRRAGNGYGGLSDLLCHIAKEFAKTCGAAYFLAVDVGNPYGNDAYRLARYYADEFGAEPTEIGRNMAFRI